MPSQNTKEKKNRKCIRFKLIVNVNTKQFLNVEWNCLFLNVKFFFLRLVTRLES